MIPEDATTRLLAFITHDGDLALAAWTAATGVRQWQPVLKRSHPALRARDGSAPLCFTAPTWSPNGRRIAVSILYAPSSAQPASALAILDLGGRDVPLLVWEAPLGMEATIAPGLPHYVNWSPDGEHLALIAVTNAGMTLFILDRRGSRTPMPLLSDAPVFFAWSARGDALLVHHGAELKLIPVDDLAHPRTLLRAGLGCQLPAWAPSGERFAFARVHRGSQSLALMAGDGSERAVADLPRGLCALAWRPTRDDVAFSIRGSGPAGADGLWLLRIGSGEPVRLFAGEVGAFFWSPDGSAIAFLAPAAIPGQSSWCVLEIRSNTIRRYAPFYKAPELALQLSFFEQYAVSHRLWSADSTALAVNGRVPANGTPPDVAGNSVYVQPVESGAPPIFVAPGAFASWRPA